MRSHTLLSLLALTLTAACTNKGNDTGDTGNGTVAGDTEAAILATYLADNNMDLPDLFDGWIIKPQDAFDAGLENYFIVDIRMGDKYEEGVNDFEEGHLPGAHNVALADVVTYVQDNNTSDLPVLVHCYTGHDAGHAVMALRLAGIPATSLMWGMSGWNSDFDLWTPNTGNAALDYPSAWTTDAAPAFGSFDPATVSTGSTDGAEILDMQVNAEVLAGLNGISAGEVLGAPGNYQVINYWEAEDYDYYGHIDGALQVTPGSLGVDTLDMLDPDATIVVYCWTGQTASMVAAWLNVMGYDAVDLKFGANTMIYDQLEAHKWGGAMDFDYVTGAE